VAASEDEAPALDVLLHNFKELADFMISLLLAVANVGEGKEGLGASKAAGKLCQSGVVGDREGVRGMKSPRESLETKDDMDENCVDV
jgi:hypothetical protein